MSQLQLSDFKVGDTAYIKRTGNASRGITNIDDLIIKTTIASVGRKYIVTDRFPDIKFKTHDFSYNGLIEHTNYSVDYELYPNKQMILDELEHAELLSFIRSKFSTYGKTEFSLQQLRDIVEIINENNKEQEIEDDLER